MITLDLVEANAIRDKAAALSVAADFELEGKTPEARPIIDALRALAEQLGPVVLQLLLLYLTEKAKNLPTPDAT